MVAVAAGANRVGRVSGLGIRVGVGADRADFNFFGTAVLPGPRAPEPGPRYRKTTPIVARQKLMRALSPLRAEMSPDEIALM